MSEKITVTAIIDAEVKKVWDLYTKPEHITQWNFADPSWHCPRATNDMRVGGKYFARMEAKDGSFGFDFEAVYIALINGKQFTYEFGGRTATVVLKDLGTQTEITVTFDPETENSIEMQKNGWDAILQNFKRYVETE